MFEFIKKAIRLQKDNPVVLSHILFPAKTTVNVKNPMGYIGSDIVVDIKIVGSVVYIDEVNIPLCNFKKNDRVRQISFNHTNESGRTVKLYVKALADNPIIFKDNNLKLNGPYRMIMQTYK